MMQSWSDRWDKAIPSAQPSGINGDPAHYEDPGKHISRSDNIRLFGTGAWCVVLPDDKAGPADKACAIDMNMDRADQNKVHNRYIEVYKHRGIDPRARYVHAFNGYNGVNQPMRYNVQNGATAVTDSSHTWHEHVETYYRYVNDPAMVDAHMSIITGETMAAYIGRTVKKNMAIELSTLLGGDTGNPGRRIDQNLQDLQNLRNYLIGERHPAALRSAPPGSPVRGLELLPQLAQQSKDSAVAIGEIKGQVGALTTQVSALTALVQALIEAGEGS